jgi:hypothetical protein
MSNLAITGIQAALRALGIGVGTGVAIEVAKETTKTNTESKEKTVAKTETTTKEKKACEKCPPDCGTLVVRNWNMSEISRLYQARITGFAPRTEWNFSGVDFDGFWSKDCTLVEAKARYDQFFSKETLEPKWFFDTFGAPRMIAQAKTQSTVANPNPPVGLNWYFMEPISYGYFSIIFADQFPTIKVYLQP